MGWSNKKGFNFRASAAFTTDNAGEIAIVENTPAASGNIPAYPVSYSLDGDTFNIGFSVNGNSDGARDRSANIPSVSDHRLAGMHGNVGATAGATLKIQAGTAAGQYKIWAGFTDQGGAPPGTIKFTLRDSNGTLTTQTLAAMSSAAQVYDIAGNLYASGSAWAAATDGAGIAITVTTTDTSNGNGGPFFYLDIGNGTTYTPLSHIAIQYLGTGTVYDPITACFPIGYYE